MAGRDDLQVKGIAVASGPLGVITATSPGCYILNKLRQRAPPE